MAAVNSFHTARWHCCY